MMSSNSDTDCFLCAALEETDNVENLIIQRSKYSFTILNRYPYTNGHIVVVPFAHEEKLSALASDTRLEMMEIINSWTFILEQEYQPDGLNVGMNLGKAAGAGVPDHLHIHIVPRWYGDTSFMSTIGHTRHLPETIEDTYNRLQKAWVKHQPIEK